MTAKPRISIALDGAQVDAMWEIQRLTGATIDAQIRLAINRFVREQLQGLVVQMQSEDRRRKAGQTVRAVKAAKPAKSARAVKGVTRVKRVTPKVGRR